MNRTTLSVTMSTPWGPSQGVQEIAPGIRSVYTASHGGLWLSPERRREMKQLAPHLFDGEWYEEDCDWARVVCAWPYLFPEDVDSARETLRNWSPEDYEAHHLETIQPGQSLKKDERLFYEAHGNDLLGVSAAGDWKEGVPEGMVEVTARQGGRQGPREAKDRTFHVPVEEYKGWRVAFIVDPARHTEVSA